jgi:hypothetical protein
MVLSGLVQRHLELMDLIRARSMEATSTFSFVLIDDIILLHKRDRMVFWSLRGKYLFNLSLFSTSTREILLCTQSEGGREIGCDILHVVNCFRPEC